MYGNLCRWRCCRYWQRRWKLFTGTASMICDNELIDDARTWIKRSSKGGEDVVVTKVPGAWIADVDSQCYREQVLVTSWRSWQTAGWVEATAFALDTLRRKRRLVVDCPASERWPIRIGTLRTENDWSSHLGRRVGEEEWSSSSVALFNVGTLFKNIQDVATRPVRMCYGWNYCFRCWNFQCCAQDARCRELEMVPSSKLNWTVSLQVAGFRSYVLCNACKTGIILLN
jgi:hypothetical protein